MTESGMYTPEAFREDAREVLLAHVRAHPFATVLTFPSGSGSGAGGEALVSHLPVLVDGARNVLRGHLARANPQAAHFAAGTPVLAIFHGPHAYVSPSVYGEPGVPTWNYVAVHAHGTGRTVDEAALSALLDETVSYFDASDWRAQVASDVISTRLGAIVGFEVDIERLEGKWKLSQNRSPADQARVAEWLDRGDDGSRAVAALMRTRLKP
jgi:transcriptional regulator